MVPRVHGWPGKCLFYLYPILPCALPPLPKSAMLANCKYCTGKYYPETELYCGSAGNETQARNQTRNRTFIRESHIHRIGRTLHSSQGLREDGMVEQLLQRCIGTLLEDLVAHRCGNQQWEGIRLGGNHLCRWEGRGCILACNCNHIHILRIHNCLH